MIQQNKTLQQMMDEEEQLTYEQEIINMNQTTSNSNNLSLLTAIQVCISKIHEIPINKENNKLKYFESDIGIERLSNFLKVLSNLCSSNYEKRAIGYWELLNYREAFSSILQKEIDDILNEMYKLFIQQKENFLGKIFIDPPQLIKPL